MSKHSGLIDGVSLWLAKKPFIDQRGYFYEKYNRDFLVSKNIAFMQENISMSLKGTIRGLHWQSNPYAQDKLVTCLVGEIFDVAVDMRRDSKTFGQYCSQLLVGADGYSLWVPKGFAHGFQALSEKSIISYSVTNDFSVENSRTINPHCPTVGIDWPIEESILSKSDSEAKTLQDLLSEEIFF